MKIPAGGRYAVGVVVSDGRVGLGLPDETYFVSNPREFSLGTEQTVTVRGRVDDLRIYVYTVNEPESRFWARGGPEWIRWGSWLPSVASVAFNEPNIDAIKRNNGFYSTALHEIGHCLGFNDWFWTPERLDLIRLPSKNYPGTDAHFIGSNAIATFNRLGGLGYRGNKVPLENREGKASRDDAALIALGGRATSMSFLLGGWVMRRAPFSASRRT